MQGTDPEDVIKNAFGCFDEDNVGLLHEDRLRELLTTIGDRFTDDEVRHVMCDVLVMRPVTRDLGRPRPGPGCVTAVSVWRQCTLASSDMRSGITPCV